MELPGEGVHPWGAEAGDLAHPCVHNATVLTNLVRKGMVERIAVDRTWAYRPLHSRSSKNARRMIQAVTSSECRAATLELFVQTLSDDDAALLRGILAAP